MREHRWIRKSTRLIGGKMGLACMLLLLACTAKAQDGPRDSGPADKQTPPALAPGAPAGSYALSGFDNVNLFNGNLNFVLPLVHIGGRGEAAYTIGLSLNSKGWNVRRTANHSHNEDVDVFFTPHLKTWNPLDVGYSAGVMVGRYGGEGHLNDALGGVPQQPCPFKDPLYEYTYTRLTFATADGTEFEFRDQLTGGQPQAVSTSACFNSIQGFDRGKVWVTFDGTAATFISDTTITDQNVSKFATFTPSGYLFFANGTRYRIVSGQVRSIQDRNGNQVTFSADATRDVAGAYTTFTITDPLGRTTKVEYNTVDATYGLGDRITYPGFNNSSRVLFITQTDLADALRSDQLLQKYTALFPELNGAANYAAPNIFNPAVTSAVYLPDGRRYRFLYNSYGELARVELPTGGAYEYDMTPGSGVVSDAAGPCSEDPEPVIYRRVVTRRTFPDGNHAEGKTTFTENAAAGTVTVDHVDPNQADQLLTREIHYFNGNAALELFAPHPAFTFWNEGKESQTDIQDGSGHLLRSTTLRLRQAGPVSWFAQWQSSPIKGTTCYNYGGEPANNPHNHETDTTLADVTPNQTSKEVFTYDQFNNVLETDEFDFGASSPTRTTVNTYLISQTRGGVSVDYVDPNVTVPTSTIHLRRLLTSTTVNGVVGGTLTPQAVTNYNYDEDGSAISDEPGIVGHDTSYGTAYQPRGNITSITRYTNAGALSGPVTSTSTYDIAGNAVSATDPKHNVTSYTYDSARGAFAFVNTLTLPIPGMNGSSSALVVHKVNDFNTGQITSFTDPNGQATRYDYTDPLDRLVSIAHPDSGGTTFIYGDTVGDLNVYTLTALDGSRNMETYTYFDGLGRKTRMLTFDGTENTPWIATDTAYDALGRIAEVSNPHRVSQLSATPDGCSTALCTSTAYDALGRVIAVTTADGQSVTTGFTGSSKRTTDQAGNTKDELIDALGRLIQVMENPTNVGGYGSPVTTYSYDAQNNLLCVHQKGTDTTPDKACNDPAVPAAWRPRNFTYDSLSRLLAAGNPESGLTQYVYDNNGNLTTRTDANQTITLTTYDGLNRPSTVTYNDGTPALTYHYDGNITPPPGSNSYSLGRLSLIHSADPSSGDYSVDQYDAMGRVLGTTQTVDGQPYVMSYQYDVAGHLTSETYPLPGKRVVQFGYDVAGRVSSVKAQSNPNAYADQIQYSAHDLITDKVLGNGLWEHAGFDPQRLQTTEIDVGFSKGGTDLLSLQYDYHDSSGKNNGNVRRQMIAAPGLAVTQLVQYDPLNRLLSMQEINSSNVPFPFQMSAVWEQDFTHDYWGNRTSLVSTSDLLTAFAPAVDANNRIDVTKDTRYVYDAAGRLKQEPVGSGVNTYSYDAEGHLIQSQDNIGTQVFKYDGRGKRVKKISGSVATVYVRDVSGDLIAEYSTAPPQNNGTRYLTQDILGSTRLVTGTDSSGNSNVAARYDYLPFGEVIPSGLSSRGSVAGYTAGPDVIRQQFAGKERDAESGLDYLGARYYSKTLGRLSSADPIFKSDVHIASPQRWNLYAYALNNPLKNVDADGQFALEGHLLITMAAFKRANLMAPQHVTFRHNVLQGNYNVDVGFKDGPAILPTTAWKQFSPSSQKDHFLANPFQKQSDAYKASIGELKDLSMKIRNQIANNSGHIEAAATEIGQALHLVQDGYAHTQRDSQNRITLIECFLCLGAGHTHNDPPYMNGTQLSDVANKAADASAAFLNFAQNMTSPDFSPIDFENQFNNFVNTYFQLATPLAPKR